MREEEIAADFADYADKKEENMGTLEDEYRSLKESLRECWLNDWSVAHVIEAGIHNKWPIETTLKHLVRVVADEKKRTQELLTRYMLTDSRQIELTSEEQKR